MLAINTYNSFDNNLTNAKAVVGLELLYESFRKQVGKFFILMVVCLVCLPFLLLFGLWLQTKRKSFQKHMKRDVKSFRNYSEYQEFKEYLSKLDNLMPSLNKVNKYNLKKVPFPFKYTLTQMQKMASTIVTYNDWQKSRLNSLNDEQFKSNGSQVFKHISERELWNNRNQAYQYWF
jgi:hypothetical protein